MPDRNEVDTYAQILAVFEAREQQLLAELTKLRARMSTVREWAGEDLGAVAPDEIPPESAPVIPPPIHTPAPISGSDAGAAAEVATNVTTDDERGQAGGFVPVAQAGEQVLRMVGMHLRPRKIAEAISQHGIPVDVKEGRLPDTVGAVLSRRASAGKTFSRAATGLYGLKEWNGLGPNETQEQLSTAMADSPKV